MSGNAFQQLSVDSIPRVALRPNEAAKAIGVSPRTLAAWMKITGFPVAKIGGTVVVPVEQLKTWLADRVATEGTEVQDG